MAKIAMKCKDLIVKEISNRLNTKDMLIVTNYKGLTAQDFDELRKEIRDISAEYVIAKDSMVKKAVVDGHNNKINELIKGEVGIAIDRKQDSTYLSKVLMKFAKSHEALKIRGGIKDGEIFSKETIMELALLPSREVMLAKLANVINAPLQGLVGSLYEIMRKVVYALNAVKDKKTENK